LEDNASLRDQLQNLQKELAVYKRVYDDLSSENAKLRDENRNSEQELRDKERCLQTIKVLGSWT